MDSGPRIEDLKGAPRNEHSSANAVSTRRLAALGSESVIETSTSMRPGWLAWAAFIFAGKIVATDFTDQDLSEEVRERFRSHASRLMFAFISPILRINEAALDNPVFATQVEHRKN